MLMFTLAISCLTTSNLPWFMDLTFQVPRQYCSLQHQTLLLSPVTFTTGCSFCFGSISSFFCSISPLISSSILGTNRSGEFIFQCPIFLPFHTVHGVLKAGILKWFAIPFSGGPHSVRPLPYDPTILDGPIWHGLVSLSWTRLWSMWSDWLVFCDCGFSLSALCQHLLSYWSGDQHWSSLRQRGDTPRPRSGVEPVMKYPMSKVREIPIRQ